MNQSGMERRVYSHREMVAALGLVLLKQGGHREPTPPATPGPNLPARPAPATAAAVRRLPAPGQGSLPPRPRTPEGGWCPASPVNNHRQQTAHRQQTGHHHHHHHSHHHHHRPHDHQQQQLQLQYQQQQNHPAPGPVVPYQHTTTTTTTTTAVLPPPPFPNFPSPHMWQHPQQLQPPLDEENIVPPPPRRAGNSRRW